jgi:hypothetical protein
MRTDVGYYVGLAVASPSKSIILKNAGPAAGQSPAGTRKPKSRIWYAPLPNLYEAPTIKL